MGGKLPSASPNRGPGRSVPGLEALAPLALAPRARARLRPRQTSHEGRSRLMRTSRNTRSFLIAAASGVSLIASCTLITDVDRSKIHDEPSSQGGAGGESTGTGGKPTTGGSTGE